MTDIAVDVALDTAFFRRWLMELTDAVEAGCDELTRLDAAIGDADHGINMLRGMNAIVSHLDVMEPQPATPRALLAMAGSRLIAVVGGAAGPLYGSAFRAMSDALGDEESATLPLLAEALRSGLGAIQRLGAAESGDKTIVDAWLPATKVVESAPGGHIAPVLRAAESAAAAGMVATIPLRARKGRASYLGWRSEGHQDPGATSTRMIFASLVAAAAN